MQNHTLAKILLTLFLLLGLAAPAGANGLKISNTSIEDRDQTAKTVVVQFDISWDNSWRNTTNHDAVWVVLKVKIGSGAYFCHGPLKTAGLNPSRTSTGSSSDLQIYIPADKMGAFIRRESTGSGTVTSQQVRLVLDWGSITSANSNSCTVTATSTLQVTVVGVEMVFIPTDDFDAGDTSGTAAGASSSNFYWSTGGVTRPWNISSEGTIITSSSSLGKPLIREYNKANIYSIATSIENFPFAGIAITNIETTTKESEVIAELFEIKASITSSLTNA
jgi:hypothetical protein